MDDGSKPENSIGSLQSGPTERGNDSLQPQSTENVKVLPVSSSVPSKVESLNSTGVASQDPNLLAKLLAVLVMMGDFQGMKKQIFEARQTSANGKIYWSVEIPGKLLAIENGKLLVDGVPAVNLLARAAFSSTGDEKSTGEL